MCLQFDDADVYALSLQAENLRESLCGDGDLLGS